MAKILDLESRLMEEWTYRIITFEEVYWYIETRFTQRMWVYSLTISLDVGDNISWKCEWYTLILYLDSSMTYIIYYIKYTYYNEKTYIFHGDVWYTLKRAQFEMQTASYLR